MLLFAKRQEFSIGILGFGLLFAAGACSTDGTATDGKRSAAKTSVRVKGVALAKGRGSGATKVSGKATSPVTPKPVPAKAQALPRLEGPHHPVFSLIDNRALAHVARGGGLVVLGSHPGISKYLSFNRPWRTWSYGRKIDGRRVTVARRNVAWLTVPLTAAQAAAAKVMVIRLKSPVPQGLRVKLNGKMLGTRPKLSAAWQRVQLDLPPKVLHAGENRVELRFARRGTLGRSKRVYAALDWLTFAAAAPAEDVKMVLTDDKGALLLPRGGSLSYYVHPYAGAKLKLVFDAQPAAIRCGVKVTIASEGAKAKSVTRTETVLTSGRVETFVDLAPIVDKVGRLTVSAEGKCPSLSLQDVAIVMPGPAATVKRPKKPKNVLFWLVDNWRADHCQLYNPKSRVETPVMSELARKGVYFDAYITGTESRVSHAAIWTGMFPKQHRFIGPKAKLPSRIVTLAEALKKAGMTTVGWTANGNISKFWGFGEGWTFFRNTLHKGGGLTAGRLANHAIDMIDKYGSNPFYMYVGTIDPHVSWKGRQPWLKRYDPEPYKGIFKRRVSGPVWDKLAATPMKISKRDRKRVLAIYDSTISYNDKHLGRVLAHLKEKGLRDDTMIVVTADHGEEFWEHGRIGHGGSVRETVVRVPLIINYPPLFGSGVRVTDGADVHSIMATVLDALGVPIPADVQAESLLPLAQGVGRGYPRALFASQYELAYTMRIGRYKMWVGGQGIPRLFDMTLPLKAREKKNVAVKHALVTRELTDALSTFLIYQRRWRQSRWGMPNNQASAFSRDLERGEGPPPIR